MTTSFAWNLYRLKFIGGGALMTYPVASPYTSAKYPDTALRLESELSKLRVWMNLKVNFQFADIFRIIFDNEAMNCYERIFTLLMKVSEVKSYI